MDVTGGGGRGIATQGRGLVVCEAGPTARGSLRHEAEVGQVAGHDPQPGRQPQLLAATADVHDVIKAPGNTTRELGGAEVDDRVEGRDRCRKYAV